MTYSAWTKTFNKIRQQIHTVVKKRLFCKGNLLQVDKI